MVRLKLGEAIRLINERDKKTQKTTTKEAQKKKQIYALQERKDFWEQYKLDKNDIRSIGTEIKAERVQRKCTSCGRAFFVLTHHKSENRKVCRVCKPY